MTLTPQERTVIADALQSQNIRKKELADALGLQGSWVTKLLNGKIKNITDEQERTIERVLHPLKLRRFDSKAGTVSTLAVQIDSAMKSSKPLTECIAALVEITKASNHAHIPVVTTKQLPKIGAALTKIVKTWENSDDPHYSKIACESLSFLRDYFKGLKQDKIS